MLGEGEKVACYIAIGYGKTQGSAHKIKTVEQVSSSAVKPLGSGGNSAEATPTWFRKGVEAALLAPTAINQQKFSFVYTGEYAGRHRIIAKRGFSLLGFTKMDLGIAKYHFEVGAGKLCRWSDFLCREHDAQSAEEPDIEWI